MSSAVHVVVSGGSVEVDNGLLVGCMPPKDATIFTPPGSACTPPAPIPAVEPPAASVAGLAAPRFPLESRDLNGVKDGSSETLPSATAQYSPSLPESYGWRLWRPARAHPAIPNPVANRLAYQFCRLRGRIQEQPYAP